VIGLIPDPPEIILICWSAAQITFIIIINVEPHPGPQHSRGTSCISSIHSCISVCSLKGCDEVYSSLTLTQSTGVYRFTRDYLSHQPSQGTVSVCVCVCVCGSVWARVCMGVCECQNAIFVFMGKYLVRLSVSYWKRDG